MYIETVIISGQFKGEIRSCISFYEGCTLSHEVGWKKS